MPIYEYECAKCGDIVEAMQKMSDKPLKTHKGEGVDCGGKLSKLMSATSFHLKGGGWHKDGYSKAAPEKKKEPAPASCDTGSCPAANSCPAVN